jgi:hypothetical protein
MVLRLLGLVAMGAVALVGSLLVLAGPASAATGDFGQASPDLQLLLTVNMLVSVLIPLLLQAIAHSTASEQYKTLLNLFITAAVGVATPFLTGDVSWGSVSWTVLLLSFGQVFVTSILSHYGLWKPLGVTGSTGSISTAIPGGLGAPSDTVITQSAPDVTLGDLANPNLTPEVSAPPATSDAPGVPIDTVLPSDPAPVPEGSPQDSGAAPSADVNP